MHALYASGLGKRLGPSMRSRHLAHCLPGAAALARAPRCVWGALLFLLCCSYSAVPACSLRSEAQGSRNYSWGCSAVSPQVGQSPHIEASACPVKVKGAVNQGGHPLLRPGESLQLPEGFPDSPAFSPQSLFLVSCHTRFTGLSRLTGVIALCIRVYLSFLTGGGAFSILLCCCHLEPLSDL